MKGITKALCLGLMFWGCSDDDLAQGTQEPASTIESDGQGIEAGESGQEGTESGGAAAESGEDGLESGEDGLESGEEGSESGEEEGVSIPEWIPGQCSSDVFLDVGNTDLYEGPGEGFGVPALFVECSDTAMIVTSNGLPHYAYQAMTPNGLSAQNFQWEIPLTPTPAATTTDIPLLGTVGFAVNGIPLYGPNEGPFPDPFGDPIANDVMDWCIGHTGVDADYHYHGFDEACLDKTTEGPSQIVGFALDGYPIYGPRGCLDAACAEVVTFKSSFHAINYEAVGCSDDSECSDSTTCSLAMIAGEETMACIQKDYAWDNNVYEPLLSAEHLDECNGRMGPDGTYRYHATATFPYGIACYKGVVSGVAGAGGEAPGEGGENPGGEGGQGGPTACETNADCVGECNGLGTGCTCNDSPMGQICVPTCDTDDDCPTSPMGTQLTCNDAGICVPGGMMP